MVLNQIIHDYLPTFLKFSEKMNEMTFSCHTSSISASIKT